MIELKTGRNLSNTQVNNEYSTFSEFLDALKAKMAEVFQVRADLDQMSINRGLPAFVMDEIMSVNPLSVCIPEAYGGRGGKIQETIALLAATSYESLSLGLTVGIN